jgi:FkbM family methyltransferase
VIEPGQVVFDIGAHVGTYTLLFARKVGSKGSVYAFEPLQDNVHLLHQVVALNGLEQTVKVEEVAVSDEAGTIEIFSFSPEESPFPLYPGPSGMNFSVIEGGGYSKKSGTTVKTITLDDFELPDGLEVDFVKIDTEGGEWKIIQGAKNFLERMTNVSLLIEVHALDLKRMDISPADLVGQIQELGFTCFGIEEQQDRLETRRLTLLANLVPAHS